MSLRRYPERMMPKITDTIRKPEYTGENRCIPCTIVNTIIAVVLSSAIALLSLPLAAVVFMVSLALIYARGYLIPYTPTLTKQYFPDSVLRLFDKHHSANPMFDGSAQEIDVEKALLEIGAITDCRNGTDFCLDPSFQSRWRDMIETVRSRNLSHEDAAQLLEVDADRLSLREVGDQSSILLFDNRKVGQWESNAAFVADVAADRLLSQMQNGWKATSVIHRGQILAALRMFLEQCPACDGPVSMGEKTVESCCRSIDVVAVTCDECDSRLFEVELTQSLRQQLDAESAENPQTV